MEHDRYFFIIYFYAISVNIEKININNSRTVLRLLESVSCLVFAFILQKVPLYEAVQLTEQYYDCIHCESVSSCNIMLEDVHFTGVQRKLERIM